VTILDFRGNKKPDSIDPESGPDLFGMLKRIEIATRTPTRGTVQGMDRSHIRQAGIEFADLREYIPGDDIRSIDWKVTARMNRPFLRECIEDRDQTYYFMVDRSGSCAYGSEFPKDRVMLGIAASLMFAAYRNGEKVALGCFTDKIERFLPPGRGKEHLITSLRVLSTHRPDNAATDLNPVVEFLCNSVRRRCVVILISDFFCPIDRRRIPVLCRKHEVCAVCVTDRTEKNLPDIGMVMMEDEEGGGQVLVDTSDRSIRSAYAARCAEYDDFVSTLFAHAGGQLVRIDTRDDYASVLNRYFRNVSRGI
jgi:uncharacterized protein (DUF58 family)